MIPASCFARDSGSNDSHQTKNPRGVNARVFCRKKTTGYSWLVVYKRSNADSMPNRSAGWESPVSFAPTISFPAVQQGVAGIVETFLHSWLEACRPVARKQQATFPLKGGNARQVVKSDVAASFSRLACPPWL
jgi:hypothetical protein